MSKTISIDVHLKPGKCGHRKIRKGKRPSHSKPTRIPRISRLMALAIKYEQLTTNGAINNQDALAQLAGVDRSQISRILRLRLLSPCIQEQLLSLPDAEEGNDSIPWKDIRPITRIHSWDEQWKQFESLLPSNSGQSG